MSSYSTRNSDIDREALRLEYCFEKGINFKDRVIQITNDIDSGASFDWLDSALSEMERGSKKAIILKINSPGGCVYEALAIVDRIKESKCHIITKGYGHIMSAASLILAAGDKRYMGSRSWLMHHELSSITQGTVSEMNDYVKQMNREMEHWAAAMASFSNKDLEYWLNIARRRDVYLTAAECLELKVVDRLLQG